ncbi:MAG: PQQ-binding-like beta-propeller repeat protein [Archaeoglobaceae archaeon]
MGYIAGNKSGENRIYCLNEDLEELWNVSVDSKMTNTPTIAEVDGEELVLFSNGAGMILAKENFYELMKEEFKKALKDLNATHLIAEEIFDTAYDVISFATRIPAINGSLSSAAIANDKAYIGSKDGKLYCINLTSFEECWNFTANGKIDSSPAIANGIVYFATNVREGAIYAVDATNGKLLWQYKLIPPEWGAYNIMSSS